MKAKRILLAVAAMTVAATPIFASAATGTANTAINATINDVISISATGTVTLSLTPTAGGVVSSGSDTVTVSTNKTNGYNLTVKDADTVTSLTSAGNTIAAHAGTTASPTALANNTWGFAVAGLGTFDASYAAETNNGSSATKWAGMPASSGTAATLKTTATTASADTTTVWYAVKATSAQPNGSYTNTVTYTATTN